MGRVDDILKKHGPMLSGALALELEQKYELSNEAARQAISRAKSPVQKIKVFPFNKNQVFCYLESQYNTSLYKAELYRALLEESAVVARILHALEESNYAMKKDLLAIYSKSPVENTKGHRNYKRVVADLLQQGILYEMDEYYVVAGDYCGEECSIKRSRSREQIERIVVNDFMSWASRINLVAFNSTTVFPSEAVFAHFRWFAFGPSYVAPLYDFKKNRPGFLVVDVLLKSYASVNDIMFFVDKVNTIRSFKGLPPFAPVLLVSGVSPEALRMLKENKVIVGILANIFDDRYVEIMMNMYNVFCNATAILMNEPQKIEQLIEDVAKSEGKFNNAMGDLFECMVGLFFNRIGSRYLELNKMVRNDKGTSYEMDVLVDREGRILVIECKALRSRLEFEYVEKWITTRVPVFRKFLNSIYPGRQLEFSIWALGGFDEHAIEFLEEYKEKQTKYKISYYSKEDIYNFAKENNDRGFCKQLDKHFKEYGVK